MNWILQQPLVIIVAGLVVELILFFVLQQTGKKWVVGAMVAVAALLVAAVALERVIVTPEEAIRSTLHEIAADAERNDIEAVVAHISRRAPDRQANARSILKMVKLEEVSVKQIQDLNVSDPPQNASVRVRVKAVGSAGMFEHQVAFREFNVEFITEDDTWKVRGWEELDSPLLPQP